MCLAAALFIALAVRDGRAATEHVGQVTHNGVAVPGATVVATQGDKKLATSTNQQGLYRFADLAEGTWTIRVDLFGFAPITKDLTVAAEPQPLTFELALLSFDDIAKNLPRLAPAAAAPPQTATNGQARAAQPAARAAAGTNGGGFQRTDVQAAARTAAAPARPPAAEDAAPPPPEQANAAADGLLVNGSVNNGAASPFAQPAAFGNNRRTGRSLYSYAVGMNLGTSAWDAKRYSFVEGSTAQQTRTTTPTSSARSVDHSRFRACSSAGRTCSSVTSTPRITTRPRRRGSCRRRSSAAAISPRASTPWGSRSP